MGKSIMDDAGSLGDSMMEDMMEAILPRILPKLKPAFKKLSEFLGKDEKRLLLQVNPADGSLHLMIIKTRCIEEFEISDEKDSYTMYPIDEFLEILMSGDISELMKTVEDEFTKESEKK